MSAEYTVAIGIIFMIGGICAVLGSALWALITNWYWNLTDRADLKKVGSLDHWGTGLFFLGAIVSIIGLSV